jgi:hypothetical protein
MQDNWSGNVVTAVGQPVGAVKIVVRAAAGDVPLWRVDVGEDVSDDNEEVAELDSRRAPIAFVGEDIISTKILDIKNAEHKLR